MAIDLNTVSSCSEEVVAREIEGEILIIPLVSGIGDKEDELYTLNETAKDIWKRLDGQRTLKEVAVSLASEFNAPLSELERDVLGFASQLIQRGILVVKK